MSGHALTHDEIEELLGAFALDAVEDDEREQIERHLRDCPRCRAEVAEHREVAAMLAQGGAPAPEGVWDRIVGALEEAPPAMRLEVGPVAPVAAPPEAKPGAGQPDSEPPAIAPVVPLAGRGRWRRVAVAVGGLVAAAAVVVLGIVAVRQQRQIDDLQAAAGPPDLIEVLADPSSRPIEMVSPDGTLHVSAVAGDDIGYVVGASLPALDDGRIYQLWGLEGETAVSLGVLGSDPSVVPFTVDRHFTGLAITSETEPVAAPTGTPVVVGEFA